VGGPGGKSFQGIGAFVVLISLLGGLTKKFVARGGNKALTYVTLSLLILNVVRVSIFSGEKRMGLSGGNYSAQGDLGGGGGGDSRFLRVNVFGEAFG